MTGASVNLLQDAQARVERLRASLRLIRAREETGHSVTALPVRGHVASIPELQPAIYDALSLVDTKCADYYAQAYLDLADASRISWIGTAHLVREALATTLRTLAPDNDVKAMVWFKPESQDGRPTHKQRVRYILQNRKAGTTEREVAEQIDLIEDRVASIVRSTYSRASSAAHTGTERREALTILRYFEAFAHDLLDLD
jgi:hypothetical protein